MTFDQALQILDIEDFKARIYNSNSHGELFHLADYVKLAQLIESDPAWFRPWFIACVTLAEQKWSRPESIFQHLPELLDRSSR